ncbi:MAG: hypothetical protein NTAFB09_19250 [Nitrosospira sp.]
MKAPSHTKWECKYYIVFISRCRRKVLYEQLRGHLGEVLRKLAGQKESDKGRALGAGSRAYADIDPSEGLGVTDSRVHQGQVGDIFGRDMWWRVLFRGDLLDGKSLFE